MLHWYFFSLIGYKINVTVKNVSKIVIIRYEELLIQFLTSNKHFSLYIKSKINIRFSFNEQKQPYVATQIYISNIHKITTKLLSLVSQSGHNMIDISLRRRNMSICQKGNQNISGMALYWRHHWTDCYEILNNQSDLKYNIFTKFHRNPTGPYSTRDISCKSGSDKHTHRQTDYVWRSHSLPDCDDNVVVIQ